MSVQLNGRIRMKIEEDPSNPKYIRTVWGFGYKWGEEDEGNTNDTSDEKLSQ